MAIVQYGVIITEARGSVGGITFSANASGPFVKSKGIPSNPRTNKQTNQRSNIAAMSELWNALTAVQKTAWDTFAALPAQELFNSLGVGFFTSGFNWHAKVNVRLLRMGRATITAVPTQARPSSPSIDLFVISSTGSPPTLTVGGTPSASSEFGGSFVAANAFDDDAATSWASAFNGTPEWVRYDIPVTDIATVYSIQASLTLPLKTPEDWTFEGFNGSTWDILDTQTGFATWTAGQIRTFVNIAQQTSFTDYRILITKEVVTTVPDVTEFKFFNDLVGVSRVEYPGGEFSGTPDFDMVLQIAQGRTTGTQVQYPNFKELLLSQTPGDEVTFFQDQLDDLMGTIPKERSYFLKMALQTTQGIRSAFSEDRTISVGP